MGKVFVKQLLARIRSNIGSFGRLQKIHTKNALLAHSIRRAGRFCVYRLFRERIAPPPWGYLKRLTRESLLSKPQRKAARSRAINKTTIQSAPNIVGISLLSVHFTR